MEDGMHPSFSQLVDTLKYITFMHFEHLDENHFLPGITISRLTSLERLLGMPIPPDVCEFWSECAGEQFPFGAAMGARICQVDESVQSALDEMKVRNLNDITLILLCDDVRRLFVGVKMKTGEVVLTTDPTLSTKNDLVVAPCWGMYLKDLIQTLVTNNGYYNVGFNGYEVLFGGGSYLQFLFTQTHFEDDVLEQLAHQSLS